jgi:hypothetical protein
VFLVETMMVIEGLEIRVVWLPSNEAKEMYTLVKMDINMV